MKKFLTVLLVIAVMFTFSFSSAFAAGMGESYVASIGDPIFEKLWTETVKITGDDTINVKTGSDTITVDKTVLAGFKTEAKAIYDYLMISYTEGTYFDMTNLANAVEMFQRYALDFKDDYKGTDVWNKKLEAFKLELAKAQYAAEKAEDLAILATIPTYNYSNEVMSATDAAKAETETTVDGEVQVEFVDKGYTYAQAAEMIVEFYEDLIDEVEDDFNADSDFGDYATAITTLFNVTSTKIYPVVYVTFEAGTRVANQMVYAGYFDFYFPMNPVDGKGVDATGVTLPAEVIGANSGFLALDAGQFVNTWYAASVTAADKTFAANVAAVKAQNAADYASFIVGKDAATIKKADKWLKVADALAEAGYARGTGEDKIAAIATAYDTYDEVAGYMADLEYYAARYAAEKNADGELMRDAAVVEKHLKKGLKAVASSQIDTQVSVTVGSNTYDTPSALATYYIGLIYDAVIDTTAAKLAFEKESVKKAVELLLADYVADEVYYAAEYADVQEAADECVAAVDAATKDADVEEAYDDFLDEVNDIKTADEVDTAVGLLTATGNLKTAASQYATYYNTYVATALDGNDDLDTTTLDDRIVEMIGESGFRTDAEVKTLKEKATEVAQGLPTVAAVKAAEQAVKDAVKAIPVKVTVADLALVQAASDAIYALEELDGKVNAASAASAANYSTTGILNAYQAQFAQAYAKVAKTDEAALKALYAEIDAVVETLEDLYSAPSTSYLEGLQSAIVNTHLYAIQQDELKVVADALAAIPINVTEADKAVVEAARAAVDAYVAKYTDVEAVYDNTNKTTFAEPSNYLAGWVEIDNIGNLTAAETVLGLNDNSEELAKIEAIASVEGLKITAKSSAKKGAITVKWTVEGDDANVQYYEVRKSTKKNSGYGTKPYFTTTKMTYKNTKGLEAGTRYYFKVRAVAEIDGEVYVSDWSNKAYRVAK